jgi:phosphate starvation-inducible PhoH-like protein
LTEDRQLTRQILLDDNSEAIALFGKFDENLKIIEKNFPVKLVARGNSLQVTGDRVTAEQVMKLVEHLKAVYRENAGIGLPDVKYAIRLIKEGKEAKLGEMLHDLIGITARGKQIKPKTLGQKLYVEAIRGNDLVFGIGPAGTGKTYLAVAMAVTALKNREVNRIILTRPAIEAGEKLGFLPGDLQDKVDPYLRPLYDSLYDIVGVETFQKYMERGIIEVAPLAYMRGRTLDDSFVILDEAQNTTPEQMKMLLTRFGFGSKAVITGDITQMDLPPGQYSGLEHARFILGAIEGIAFIYFSDRDVVRHELVQKIIKAYEKYDQEQKENL